MNWVMAGVSLATITYVAWYATWSMKRVTRAAWSDLEMYVSACAACVAELEAAEVEALLRAGAEARRADQLAAENARLRRLVQEREASDVG
jgi:hypothetical protein